MNLVLSGERPATNRLGHGTVLMKYECSSRPARLASHEMEVLMASVELLALLLPLLLGRSRVHISAHKPPVLTDISWFSSVPPSKCWDNRPILN
jgi:hypothetical protein